MDWSVAHYTDRSSGCRVMFWSVVVLVFLRRRQHHMKTCLEGILQGNTEVHLIPTLLQPHTGSLNTWLQVLQPAAYNIPSPVWSTSSAVKIFTLLYLIRANSWCCDMLICCVGALRRWAAVSLNQRPKASHHRLISKGFKTKANHRTKLNKSCPSTLSSSSKLGCPNTHFSQANCNQIQANFQILARNSRICVPRWQHWEVIAALQTSPLTLPKPFEGMETFLE